MIRTAEYEQWIAAQISDLPTLDPNTRHRLVAALSAVDVTGSDFRHGEKRRYRPAA